MGQAQQDRIGAGKRGCQDDHPISQAVAKEANHACACHDNDQAKKLGNEMGSNERMTIASMAPRSHRRNAGPF